MPAPTRERLLEVALAASEAAGKAAMRWFRADPPTGTKADGTLVTEADRDAERVLRSVIRTAFPDHGILGEEEGEVRGTAPYRWVLDPVDGTKSFVHGVPLWGTLVAVEHEGVPVVGVCRMPALGETVAAAKGLGCEFNGRPCRVSDVRELSKALLVLTSPRAARRRTPRYLALEDQVAFVRGWSDCYAYCLVATGRADVALDPAMNPWDCGPFATILEEAGGRFTDWRGAATIHGGDALASNGHLHQAALDVLTG
jgi:histidinol-phosphatase